MGTVNGDEYGRAVANFSDRSDHGDTQNQYFSRYGDRDQVNDMRHGSYPVEGLQLSSAPDWPTRLATAGCRLKLPIRGGLLAPGLVMVPGLKQGGQFQTAAVYPED